MSMTKKNYEAFAKLFREELKHGPGGFDPDEVFEGLALLFERDNPRFSRSRFLAACRGESAKDSAGRTVRYSKTNTCNAGICPACSKPVPVDDPDGPVWTCPADLSPGNPFWEPADERITEELRRSSGVFSNCGEDFGFPCYERLPLHSECYDRGGY